MAGPSFGGRLVEELEYENQTRLVSPLALSVGYQQPKFRLEAEFGYYQMETSEDSFGIVRNHYEQNLLLHIPITGEFQGWTPRVLGGVSFFQEIVTTSVFNASETMRSQIELAPVFGLGVDGPIAPNLMALVEARGMYSEAYSPNLPLELNLGLLFVF